MCPSIVTIVSLKSHIRGVKFYLSFYYLLQVDIDFEKEAIGAGKDVYFKDI